MSTARLSDFEKRSFTAKDVATYARFFDEPFPSLRPTTVSTLAYRNAKGKRRPYQFLTTVGEEGARRTRRFNVKQVLAIAAFNMVSYYGVPQELALKLTERIYRGEWDFADTGRLREVIEEQLDLAVVLFGSAGRASMLFKIFPFTSFDDLMRKIKECRVEDPDLWEKGYTHWETSGALQVYAVSYAIRKCMDRLAEAG